MAQEANEGIAYLRALKLSVSPLGATAAPAHETGSEGHPGSCSTVADAGERFKGAEKRRSPRYKCEGSAELREDGCDVRNWATFSDISLHGCYVEAQATYPVGTALHMKLEAKGSVRVSYPYLGMGTRLRGHSAENQARLRELLAMITRPTVIMGPGMASSLPARGPLDAVPQIADPGAALQALTEFFESRQMLMREDFLRILHQSQNPGITR
jgi:hypothetical protein